MKKVLGAWFATAACLGGVIGLGILRTPGEIAAHITNPILYLALWIGGGLFSLICLLFVAELVTLTPRSGGVYALATRAFGPYVGFLTGWTDWVAISATCALKAVVILEYTALLLPEIEPYKMPGAVFVTSVFALLQIGGIQLASVIQQLGAVVIGCIISIVIAALFYGAFSVDVPGIMNAVGEVSSSPTSIAELGVVAAAIVFTYDGWLVGSYFSGEMKGGVRMVVSGSIRGLLLIIIFYALLNLALLISVPMNLIEGHDLAVAGALDILYGEKAAGAVAVAAIFILFAHQNLHYLTGPRTLYALSIDGLGSDKTKAVSGRGTPVSAVIATWILTVSVILSGGFYFLLSLTAMLFLFMYIIVNLGVFYLRRTEPDTKRPYRAWAYPVSGIVTVTGWIGILILVGISEPQSFYYALGLIAVSVPVYFWLKSRRH